MKIGELNALINDFTVRIALEGTGHKMSVQIQNKGNGCIYGATVVEHFLPRGVRCNKCEDNLVSLHTTLEDLIRNAIFLHLENCENVPRVNKFRVIKNTRR